MPKKNKILGISGSTRKNSANLQILEFIMRTYADQVEMTIYEQLQWLPHFNPDIDKESPPEPVLEFRNKIKEADGVIICTPEYVFSLPGSLKNAIEWTVSTTLFSDLPVALITASGLGEKAHESLLLIMKTIYARTSPETQLLIQGARSKINADGKIIDQDTLLRLNILMQHFLKELMQ